jgi:ABC-type amino acid transport substrate-binding protein
VVVRYYPSFEAAAAAVTSGEAIAMGGNFVDLDAWARAHAGFAIDARPVDERPVAVAVAQPNLELLRAVNDTIDELKRTGELRRMTQKWHLPYLLP